MPHHNVAYAIEGNKVSWKHLQRHATQSCNLFHEEAQTFNNNTTRDVQPATSHILFAAVKVQWAAAVTAVALHL